MRTLVQQIVMEMSWVWPLVKLFTGLAVLEAMHKIFTESVLHACSSPQALLHHLR